ncbi:tRNA-uridine aminocarboxypropyltransferase [Pseudomonas typographi]|uniref:tRNA-uridine aminocarboxypropyltransferase n=1 Tax=Pseudomonas typographi TaxID=2715964 RepID=A0ABR7Z5Q7_9PSED|nr:DTW domain-containing protein [Pseudomonas typographi]MBD1586905.1 DTW domain-containing protein [Pseudomonas typographi]MBD1600636.1 DTW domain-containing protein [Pseudomonas typographi]
MTPGARPRCSRCQRPPGHCLCALLPSLASRTRVLVLQHPSETHHALNTGRLAALGLANAALKVGEQFAPGLWEQRGYTPCVLFPGDGAEPLRAGGPPRLLIVPDGTWRKARKLLHLNPTLAALPRVALSEPGPSNYRLRKAPGPDALATIEAIVQALETLEAPASFQALLRPFEALIDGQIQAMGTATFARNHQRQ